mgnify:CR=1 FL=1
MGGGRGRWGSGEWGVAGQPQRPKKGRQGNVGQAFLPARVCQRRQECPRHTGAQSSLPVGSPGRAGSPGSAGGLEDEDEDEDDWSGLMRFCRPFFSFRQSVGTKCGDEAYPTKRGDKVRGQSVSAKHPTPNPLLNYSYSTRLLLAGFIGSFSLHRSSVSGDRSSLCQG